MNNKKADIPQKILDAAQEARCELVPEKSRPRYLRAYKQFLEWRKKNNVEGICSEEVLLAYVKELSQTSAPSTAWSNYSMIKKILLVEENKDVSQNKIVNSYLKVKSKGYVPKQAKIFRAADVARFFIEAEDVAYLAIKVS